MPRRAVTSGIISCRKYIRPFGCGKRMLKLHVFYSGRFNTKNASCKIPSLFTKA